MGGRSGGGKAGDDFDGTDALTGGSHVSDAQQWPRETALAPVVVIQSMLIVIFERVRPPQAPPEAPAGGDEKFGPFRLFRAKF